MRACDEESCISPFRSLAECRRFCSCQSTLVQRDSTAFKTRPQQEQNKSLEIYEFQEGSTRLGTGFGTRGSEVQILSPRPMFSRTYGVADRPSGFAPGSLVWQPYLLGIDCSGPMGSRLRLQNRLQIRTAISQELWNSFESCCDDYSIQPSSTSDLLPGRGSASEPSPPIGVLNGFDRRSFSEGRGTCPAE